jgi:chitinase
MCFQQVRAQTVSKPALLGYWQDWDDAGSPYIPLSQVDARYNNVVVAFAVPVNGTVYQIGFTPISGTQADFISQIQALQSQGRKVIVSIGGETDPVSIQTAAQRDIFISSLDGVLNTYGFDGVDIDFEGSSLSVSGGTIAAPVDAPIVNLIAGLKQVMQDYRAAHNKKLLLTMAPETADVQGGMSAYGGIWGSQLPVINALRDSLDILQVQLYNTGSMFGVDGKIYTEGTADFIVAETEAVIKGFNTAGGAFAGLPASKVAIGLPACASAAGGGFTDTATVRIAINYLLGKGPKPGSYTLEQAGGYPSLGGMMDWSINWDKVCSNNTYAANFQRIFGNTVVVTQPPVVSSAATANGTVGTAFNYSITATNSPTSYSATTLPGGLTINTSTGIITGIPAAAVTSTVTVSAINAGGTGTKAVTITIAPAIPGAPVISSAPTVNGTIGTAFTYNITATGIPTSYSVGGTLPAGLTFSGSTISGTPTVAGTYTDTVKATNASGTAKQIITITIISINSPVITSAPTASGTVGAIFSYNIAATDNPVRFAVTGTLPAGLTVSGATISGTPTAAGTFVTTIKATNAGGTGTATLTISIGTAGTCTVPAWNAATQYVGSSVVSRGGNQYTAKWWTQNEDPLLKSGQYDVWQLNGPCGGGTVNINPTVAINSPENSTSFTAPANIVITATAADADGTVARVDFYNGSTLLGTATASPYSFAWNNVTAGSYTITAKATDNAGGTSTSAAISITINSVANINPTIAITAPAINATYTTPATVVIAAAAADANGTIAKVDFYNGTTLLGTSTTAPYNFTWSNVAAGTYTLTAKATDNAGGSATSAPVAITVTATTGPDACATIAQYASTGGNYGPGSIVKNQGNQYQCKPWPYSGWCSIAPSAYAPGTGTNWTDAWTLVGSCTATQSRSELEDPAETKSGTTANDVTLYPNPGASGRAATITLLFDAAPGDIQLNVIDANGKTVATQHYSNVEKSQQVALPALSSGFYFIHIQGEHAVWNKKYLIQ